MASPRVLVVVLAGGAGGRLELLTRHRAKPAVPYGGMVRLVDFPLSNCLHAGLSDVWVVEQFNPVSLADHLSSGRAWDLDRTAGGLLVLHPHRGGDREGWHSGTADALWRQAELIRQFDPASLVVVSADAVYRMDYEALAREHRERRAPLTIVTTRVAREDAGRYGVVQVAADGRVRDYAYKPEQPASDVVSNEVFVFDPGPALDRLEELAARAGDEGLDDLGTSLLPSLVADGAAVEHRHDGYWRDVGTVPAYWESHMDLVAENPPFDLHRPDWPIRTTRPGAAPARVAAGARVEQTLLSPGCTVAGTVRRSVLSPQVVVEAGAEVVDSVLLPGAVVRRGARVERAVLDDGVQIEAGAQVGGGDGVALVGLSARVGEGQVVPADGRYPVEDGAEA